MSMLTDAALLLFPRPFAMAVLTAMLLLLLDALFGMMVAIKAETFDINRVADYLSRDNALKIAAWLLLSEFAALADYANVGLDFGGTGLSTFIGSAAAVTVIGPLFAQFVLKALKLFGVVPIEAVLAMRKAPSRMVTRRIRAHTTTHETGGTHG
jgi:hypothetical protein